MEVAATVVLFSIIINYLHLRCLMFGNAINFGRPKCVSIIVYAQIFLLDNVSTSIEQTCFFNCILRVYAHLGVSIHHFCLFDSLFYKCLKIHKCWWKLPNWQSVLSSQTQTRGVIQIVKSKSNSRTELLKKWNVMHLDRTCLEENICTQLNCL